MPLSPDDIIASAEAVELLGQWHDFQSDAGSGEPAWFAVDGIPVFRQIGRDGAGGVFALLPPTQRVLYVSSDGQAGIIAADFEELFQLIVACPYWHDVLKFSGNGQLDESLPTRSTKRRDDLSASTCHAAPPTPCRTRCMPNLCWDLPKIQ